MRAKIKDIQFLHILVLLCAFCICRHTPAGLKELRSKMNARAQGLILGWLKEKGLAPDVKSELGRRVPA